MIFPVIKQITGLLILQFLAINIAIAQTANDGINAYDAGDYSAAVEILSPLANRGDIRAQSMLGVMYYNGQGVKEDNAKAHALFKHAAERGDTDAQFNLANMYMYSPTLPIQVEDRDIEAARWFFNAAQQGHSDAQYHLGLLLMAGTGVAQNPDEAYLWIRRAAAQDHKEARIFIGEYED